MRRISFFLFIVLCAGRLMSQTACYEGFVRQAGGNAPMESVTVCLLAADSSIVCHSYSDEKGHFELQAPLRGGRFLSFSFMGYKRKILGIETFSNGMTISLEEDVFRIREVKVSSNRIRQQNDTLVYSVAGFKMPQDRSIEEVLKRVPGIEVAANGQIKFQDKPISNFYIEGLDLLGGKYVLASKNVPARMVKEVQVLQSHQPVAVLRGKSFSDNAALNLVLEDEARNRLIGQADVGAGSDDGGRMVWKNRLMLMLFGKHRQNLTLYKNNNTGNDLAAEISPVTANKSENEGDFFSASFSGVGKVSRSRYLANNAHVAAVNHLRRLDKEDNLRLQVTALHDEQSAGRDRELAYFYPSQTVLISETEQYRSVVNNLEAELSYERNSKNIYVKNRTKGMTGLHKSALSMQTNGKVMDERNHPQRKYLQNNFELIKNRNKHTLALYSKNGYSELPQYMTVTPGIYEDLLNNGQTYDYLKQEALLRTFQSDNYTYFQHKVAGFFLKYKAGVFYENRNLQSQTFAGTLPVSEINCHNNLRLETVETYVEPSLTLKNETWNLLFRIPLTFHYAHLKDLQTQSAFRLLPTPSLNLRYELNAYWTVSGTSILNFQKPDIRKLYTGYLFNSYRSAQAFTQELTYDKSLYNSLKISYGNPLSGIFASLNGFYNCTWEENMRAYDNKESFLTLNRLLHQPHTTRLFGGAFRGSKAFGWNKLCTAVSVAFTQQRNKMLLEQDLVDSHLSALSASLEVSAQPSRHVNLTGKSSASFSRAALGDQKQSASWMRSYEHTVNLSCIFSPKWQWQIDNTASHDSRNKRVTYFMDSSITYIINRCSLELEAKNLLNHKRLSNVYISDWMSRTTTYALRSREIMLKAAFSF